MKTDRNFLFFVPSFRRVGFLLAACVLFGGGVRAQFVPGSGGAIPADPPFMENPGEFGGLRINRIDRFGGKDYLGLEFPPPSDFGAGGYRLQRSLDGTSGWTDHPWGGGLLETSSDSQDNFAFEPDGNYFYRLLALGGPRDGDVSNAVQANRSLIGTYFASWSLDESMDITGVMWPWAGRGLSVGIVVKNTSDNSEVGGGVGYQWYRVNPATWEFTAIDGATGTTYATTEADAGGYLLVCRATGDGTTVGGFLQIFSGGVLIPNQAYVTQLSRSGFRLNLHRSVPSLLPADLELTYWDGASIVEIPVDSVAPIGGNAIFQIAANIPPSVEELWLNSKSETWSLARTTPMGDLGVGLTLTYEPEISVLHPAARRLVDGRSRIHFGTVKRGRRSAAKVFTIRNEGSDDLVSLAVSRVGSGARHFVSTAARRGRLAPGQSTTFKLIFKPRKKGSINAIVRVRSNDADENPFDIRISGRGR